MNKKWKQIVAMLRQVGVDATLLGQRNGETRSFDFERALERNQESRKSEKRPNTLDRFIPSFCLTCLPYNVRHLTLGVAYQTISAASSVLPILRCALLRSFALYHPLLHLTKRTLN